jgi:GMP synthase (glutamine-hydrolysing)
MKPFLILQLRPEDEASDGEFEAFLKIANLKPDQVHRVRMEKEDVPRVSLDDYSGVIVGGGPSNVSSTDKDSQQKRFEKQLHNLLGQVVERDFPFLGACYGIGILANHLGGVVSTEKYGEGVGATSIELTDEALDDPLMQNLPQNFRAFGGHKESCQNLPPKATLLAKSNNCPIQMIRVKKNIYATQFHPELDSHGIALRIRIYKNHGYFKPEEADKLIADAMEETIAVPELILQNFATRYKALK